MNSHLNRHLDLGVHADAVDRGRAPDDVPSNPVAEAGAGLSIPAEDAPAMAEAIKTLLALSPEERWEMGLRGRRYVETHHDVTRLAERFEACLLSAVRGDRITRDTEPLPTTPSGG